MTTTSVSQPSPAQVQELLRQGKALILFEGVICLLGGVLAILFPVVASEGLELFLGGLCAVLGVLGLVRCLVGGVEHRLATVVTSGLLLVLGVLMLLWPLEGLEAITLLLAAGSFIRGVADVSGFPARSVHAPGLQVISGLAGIVIAVLLALWYPSDALWAPGLLFGIQLLFFGMMLMSLWSVANTPVADPPQTAAD